MSIIREFGLQVPQAQLDDLRRRLETARWPDAETVDDWSQGVPIAKLKSLVDYWMTEYDWRRCERLLNQLGQFKTVIDGLDLYFLHVRSPHSGALPLIMTHGWPGSVLEFHKVVGPLTDPTAHGGQAGDAFHLVIPALPGFGFSQRPAESGWGIERIAGAWTELMRRLGYDRFVAQGGDWGSAVTVALGAQKPPELMGIHLNMLNIPPVSMPAEPDESERRALATARRYAEVESGYARLQATRPQTLGYALADSPIGQAAWIYEKLTAWSDCHGAAENIFTIDEIIDTVMMYWIPNVATSSARLYWESLSSFQPKELRISGGLQPLSQRARCTAPEVGGKIRGRHNLLERACRRRPFRRVRATRRVRRRNCANVLPLSDEGGASDDSAQISRGTPKKAS